MSSKFKAYDGISLDGGRLVSFFSTKTRVTVFLCAFMMFVLVQASMAWIMYAHYRDTASNAVMVRLEAAASVCMSALESARDNMKQEDLQALLLRIRESHRLEALFVVGEKGTLLYGAGSAKTGRIPSVFDVSPGRVRAVFQSEKPSLETINIMGIPYIRIYRPLRRDGSVIAVLCVSVYNTVPDEIVTVKGALGAAVGMGMLTTLLLSAMVLGMVRFVDRSRQEGMRAERLSTVGTLSASIAHEVKNPLGVILSAVQLVQKSKNLQEKEHMLLTIVEEEVRQASDQIESFLDLARDIPLHMRNEDLSAFIRGTASMFLPRCRERGIQLNIDVPDAVVLADMDRRKMRRLLVNLILNALEALVDVDQPAVTVELKVMDDGIPEIRVIDNGPGIPDEIRKKIFIAFYTTKQSGTGLGLTVVRQIADQHGAKLSIITSSESGTKLVLRLEKVHNARND